MKRNTIQSQVDFRKMKKYIRTIKQHGNESESKKFNFETREKEKIFRLKEMKKEVEKKMKRAEYEIEYKLHSRNLSMINKRIQFEERGEKHEIISNLNWIKKVEKTVTKFVNSL